MQEYMPFLRFNAQDYSHETVVALCVVMLVAGLLSLLYGFRLYRVVVVAATAILGGYLGWALLSPLLPENIAWLAPVGLALVGALGALAVQKIMVFLAGAAVGFISLGPVVAETIWTGAEGPTSQEYMIAAAVCFLVMGILSLFLFKPIVTVATAMFGSTLVTSAVVHFLEGLSENGVDVYQSHPRELAWTFVGVAVVGVLFQAATRKKKER